MEDLQAISFDVGGTLIRPWPSVGHVYAAVAAEHGVPGLSPGDLNRRFRSAWESTGCRAETKQDWATIVRETFKELGSIGNPDNLFETLYLRFAETRSWRVFEDVLPTLHTLKSRGFRMGILSNWDARLRPLLDRLGLAEFFEVMVVSCEAGFRKPEVEIFHCSIRAFGLPPAQILHVGDNPQQDLLGARQAGMQSLGIRRDAPGSEPDWISGLDELPGRF